MEEVSRETCLMRTPDEGPPILKRESGTWEDTQLRGKDGPQEGGRSGQRPDCSHQAHGGRWACPCQARVV